MLFCSYKNIFGKPKTGIHQYRIFGMAFFDILGLIIITILISKYLDVNFIYTLIFMILITILIHWLFCVTTAANVAIGLADEIQQNPQQHFLKLN